MNSYVDTLTGNIVSVGWAAKEYNLRGAKYPLLPGVIEYCNLSDFTPTVAGDDEVLLQTATESGGVWTQDVRAKTTEELNAVEAAFVSSELVNADIEVRKWEDGHARTTGTNIAQWRSYRNALRDHIIGGVVQGNRPTKPGV